MTTAQPAAQSTCTRNLSPAVLAAELDNATGFLERLAVLGPSTLTIRQALFFVAVAKEDLRHHRVTLTGIRAAHDGLGRAIAKSKDMLLEPSRAYPQATGWLTQEHDPEDRRVRYLRLTPRGLNVLAQALGH